MFPQTAASSKTAILSVLGLEMNLPGKFEDAGVTCARHSSKCRRTKGPIGVVQGRRVRYIKAFRPELQAQPLGDPEDFGNHEIGFLQAGASHRIPGAVPNRELRSDGESGCIEPLRCAAVCEQIWICHAVRSLYSESQAGIRIGRL